MSSYTQYVLCLLIVAGLSACGGGSNKLSPANSSSGKNSSAFSSVPESILSSSRVAVSSSSDSTVPTSSVAPASSSSADTSSSATSSSASSQSSVTPLFVIANGIVVDEFGSPVDAATISVEGTNIVETTAADGSFSLDLSVLTPAVLRITKSGYASTIRAAAAADDNGFFANRIVMHSVGAVLNFDATLDNSLRVPGSVARVDLPASSLVNADGSAFVGTAQVTLTPIDPSVNIDFMPGVMVDSGTGTAIESMGAIGVEFTDANGLPLNLGANKTAQIRIPATPAPGVTPPATIPLYHLNETTGLWEQDGIATLETDPATGKQYYAGEASHFSWWNADQMFDRATIDYSQSVSSAQCNYDVFPGNATLVMQGVDFLGRQTLAPKTGEPLYAKALANARLMLVVGDSVVDALNIVLPASGASVRLPRCLAVPQQVTVSGNVTVTSGDLSVYRVQISGASFLTKTVGINADGHYSASVYANTGDITARLIGGIAHRYTSASNATVTVANSDVAFADLSITDDQVVVSGCINGWDTYPYQNAQLNIFKDGKLVESLFEANSQNASFSFAAIINQTVDLVITPAGNNLQEKIIPIDVTNINLTLDNCVALPKGPTAVVNVSGSGLTRTFSASNSIAGDAAIVKYEWSFSDGATAEGETVAHTFAAFGSYFVSLKITDELTQQGSANAIPVTVVDNSQAVDIKPARISSGNLHSCAITTEAGVKCWGNNHSGQLGNGSFDSGVDLFSATPIAGLSDIVAVSAGGDHSCAITSQGELSCWGRNFNGELGNGTTTDSNIPVVVIGSNVVAVSAGEYHTCALLASGGVKCWGDNSAGQLGTGVINSSATPVDVVGLDAGVHTIAAGGGHSCAATSGAGVLCWGDNDGGELGNSTTEGSRLPVAVTGLSEPIISLVLGYEHSCAVTDAGIVKCWGANGLGQLGNGSETNSSVPVTIANFPDIRLVQAGRWHTCALNVAGYTSCWGSNTYGQLGDNSGAFTSAIPVSATVQTDAAEAISLGSYNTCVIAADGNVQCWGWDQTYEPGG